MGANQLLPTLIGFVILMIIVTLQSGASIGNSITQTLLIAIPGNDVQKTKLIEEVSGIIEKSSSQLEIKRVQINEDLVSMNFLVNVKSIEKLNEINQGLLTLNPKIETTFLDTTI